MKRAGEETAAKLIKLGVDVEPLEMPDFPDIPMWRVHDRKRMPYPLFLYAGQLRLILEAYDV